MSTDRRVLLLFLALGIVWGIPYLLIKIAVAELEPTTLVLARTALAAAIMVPLAARQRALAPVLRRWVPVLAYTVVEIVVPWYFLARAEQQLSSSLTGLLLAGVPVVGVVIALLTRRSENLGVAGGLGLLVGMVGVALLVGFDGGLLGGGGAERSAQLVAMGELAVVVVLYAIGPVIMTRWMADLPATGVIAVSLAVAALVYAVPGVLQAPRTMPSVPTIVSVLVLAAVCTALAFVLFFALVAEVGAVRTTLITYINPAVAVVAGVLVLDEKVTWATVSGFALVVAGSALASRRPRGSRVIDPGEPVRTCPPEPGADLATMKP